MSRILKSSKLLSLIGCLFFLIGMGLVIVKLCLNFKSDSTFDIKIENNNFYNLYNSNFSKNTTKSETTNYIAYLKIPKINLIGGLLDKSSEFNTVDKNIQIIKESDMPDIEKSNLILAAHSGNSNISFFKDLDNLTLDDTIYLEYNNKQYEYKITNYYIVEKTGFVNIIRNQNKTVLTLITCLEGSNKQIVIISELYKTKDL